jgi:hypothetical protein
MQQYTLQDFKMCLFSVSEAVYYTFPNEQHLIHIG